MPHISSKKLKKEHLQRLYNEFSSALEKSAKKSWIKFFLNDFLTRTEKIMLAKRFAVIYLLSKNIPITYILDDFGKNFKSRITFSCWKRQMEIFV